jgi:hypothetical protein
MDQRTVEFPLFAVHVALSLIIDRVSVCLVQWTGRGGTGGIYPIFDDVWSGSHL